jgi:hypothetical protein
MRKLPCALLVMSLMMLPLSSCHKKKPTEPDPQAFAVSLRYLNYGWGYCLRLIVGPTAINRCGLGESSLAVWAGDYECKLYTVTNPGPGEILALIATSPLHLDRNFTCVVDGGDIYWLYWE